MTNATTNTKSKAKRKEHPVFLWLGLFLFLAASVVAEWFILDKQDASLEENPLQAQLVQLEDEFKTLQTIDFDSQNIKHQEVAKETANIYLFSLKLNDSKKTFQEDSELLKRYNKLYKSVHASIKTSSNWSHDYYNKILDGATVDETSKDISKFEAAIKSLEGLARIIRHDATIVQNIISKQNKDVNEGLPLWKTSQEKDDYIKAIEEKINIYKKRIEALSKEKEKKKEEAEDEVISEEVTYEEESSYDEYADNTYVTPSNHSGAPNNAATSNTTSAPNGNSNSDGTNSSASDLTQNQTDQIPTTPSASDASGDTSSQDTSSNSGLPENE